MMINMRPPPRPPCKMPRCKKPKKAQSSDFSKEEIKAIVKEEINKRVAEYKRTKDADKLFAPYTPLEKLKERLKDEEKVGMNMDMRMGFDSFVDDIERSLHEPKHSIVGEIAAVRGKQPKKEFPHPHELIELDLDDLRFVINLKRQDLMTTKDNPVSASWINFLGNIEVLIDNYEAMTTGRPITNATVDRTKTNSAAKTLENSAKSRLEKLGK